LLVYDIVMVSPTIHRLQWFGGLGIDTVRRSVAKRQKGWQRVAGSLPPDLRAEHEKEESESDERSERALYEMDRLIHEATWQHTLNIARRGVLGFVLIAVGSLMQAATAILQYALAH
jgi:hypothetical protein